MKECSLGLPGRMTGLLFRMDLKWLRGNSRQTLSSHQQPEVPKTSSRTAALCGWACGGSGMSVRIRACILYVSAALVPEAISLISHSGR